MKAACPTHGLRQFVRDDELAWSHCDLHDTESLDSECSSVVSDEHLTPDGGDVMQWDEHDWESCRACLPHADRQVL